MCESSTNGDRELPQLRRLPELTDVNSDQQDRGLEASLVIDRDTASRLGISPRRSTTRSTVPSASARSRRCTSAQSIPRRHGSGATFLADPESLKYIYVKVANDTLVPLSAFTHYAPSTTPLAVNHQGQFPRRHDVVQSRARRGAGRRGEQVERAMRDMGVPSTIRGSFQGIAQAFQDSHASQPFLIARGPGDGLHRARHPV